MRAQRYSSALSLTSGIHKVVVMAAPWPLYSRERRGTHCIIDWVGPRAGLDGCGKYCLTPGFKLRSVKPIASRYTDRATLSHMLIRGPINNTNVVFSKALLEVKCAQATPNH
jgi:hypothetical protein